MPEGYGGMKSSLSICRCCHRFRRCGKTCHMIPARFSCTSLCAHGRRPGFGNTDAGLRVLGLYVGLFLLLAFWFASWTMRKGAPLLAVTLAGLNVTMIRAGDSLRGYGLGSALAVLTLALIWRLTCRPSLATFSCAAAVAVLKCSVALSKCLFCIRRVLRRICAMRRGTAVA